MQQTGSLRQLRIEAHFRGHGGTKLGDLPGMLQEVLTIGGTEPHPSHHSDQFRMKSVNAELDTGSLTYFYNFFFNILLRLGDDLFYPGRVDPTILYEPVQGQTRNLPAYGIKTGDNDRFRRVVYDNLYASRSFQCTDIPTFPTDYLPFDVVTFNVEDRHAIFDGVLGSFSLDSIQNDLFRLLGGA